MDMRLAHYIGFTVGMGDIERLYEESFYATAKAVFGIKLARTADMMTLYKSLVNEGYQYDIGYDGMSNAKVIELLGRTLALANHGLAHSIDPDDIAQVKIKNVTKDYKGFYIQALARAIVYYVAYAKDKDTSELEARLEYEEEASAAAELCYESESEPWPLEEKSFHIREEIYYKQQSKTLVDLIFFLKHNGFYYELTQDEKLIANELQETINANQVTKVENIEDIELSRLPALQIAKLLTDKFIDI